MYGDQSHFTCNSIINFATCVVALVVSLIFIVPTSIDATPIAATITITTNPSGTTARLHGSKFYTNAYVNLIFT